VRLFTTLAEVDSTNSWLTERLAHLDPWHTVRARVQTAGRGRLTRSWFSGGADANLAFSMIVPVAKVDPGAISARVGLALQGALSLYAEVKLRWPNDIVVQGRKLAGVLISQNSENPHRVVVGIGVNVNSEDFPREISGTATSLALAAGRQFRVQKLWLQIWKAVQTTFFEGAPTLDADFIARYNRVAWPYVRRSEISEELLQFQTLLPDGRALCLSPEGPATLDMAP
jgi:BirA family biotin operon repressor/biotin-[acetyl-CoA-carboxylase] ligase